jgi:hypothetical protein
MKVGGVPAASFSTSRLYLPTPRPSARLCSPRFSAAICPPRRSLFVFSVGRLVSRRCHSIVSLACASSGVRYHEGSDSWAVSPHSQVSLRPAPDRLLVPSPTTACPQAIAFPATAAWPVCFRLRHLVEGSSRHPAESRSSSYRPRIRFQVLPTPPRGDAVSFSYGGVAYSDTDLHRADQAPL